MTTPTAHAKTAPSRKLAAGVAGGLAGGVVFGVLMQMLDMLPMVAMLVDSDSVAVGWLVHLVIAAVLGAGFAAAAGSRLGRLTPVVWLGVAYGAVWWVLGGLVIMPARLGMDLFALDTTAWQSLMGHVLYGSVLGVIAALMAAWTLPER